MVIIVPAIIAACLLFGSRAVSSALGQILLLVGLGAGLIAAGLLGIWVFGSAAAGAAIAFALLIGFFAWAHFSTPKELRGMTDNEIQAKITAAATNGRQDGWTSTKERQLEPWEQRYWALRSKPRDETGSK